MSTTNAKSTVVYEQLVRVALAIVAAISVAVTLVILWILIKESSVFFKNVSLVEFFTGLKWEPLLEPKSFGILPLICGTLLITIGAAAIAIPLGMVAAIYLSEYASYSFKSVIKPCMEVLAGIPTIVYGFFALTFITPILKMVFPETQVFNALSGAIVVAVMILPMVSSLVDDAFSSVPRGLKEGAYAVGATSFEVIGQIMIPQTLSRILASFILAISRAVGETMAVTLAAGANPQVTLNPLESIQTMTSYIVQVSLGDTPAGGIEYLSSYAVATVLFAMTLSMNMIGQMIIRWKK
jgi:phosphate transport system permease protein